MKRTSNQTRNNNIRNTSNSNPKNRKFIRSDILADQIRDLEDRVEILTENLSKYKDDHNKSKNDNNKKSMFDDPILNMRATPIIRPIEGNSDNFISNIFSLFSGTQSSQKSDPVEDDPTYIEEVFDDNDEFEELDCDIKTLDDLIKLADMFPSELLPDNNKNNVESKLFPEIELNNNTSSIPLFKMFKDKLGDDEKPKEPKIENLSYCVINNKKYSINFNILNKLKPTLEKLNKMIGLEEIKNKIVDMILYHIQHLENTNSMLHTIIEGPPGVGKTELGKILGEIYAGLGIIKTSKIKVVKRADLIGEHLGSTAQKTQRAIDEAGGGVLFIDEAYSLGNEDKKDIYAKECIDTLNYNLSENRKKFICIIAGYPDDLERCFFSINKGLRRRFPFKYTITGYTYDELCKIFLKKLMETKWDINVKELNDNQLNDFFKEHMNEFVNYGGDIENLITHCKFMHSRRIFGKHPKLRKKLNNSDITDGLIRFKDYKKNNDPDTAYKLMFC